MNKSEYKRDIIEAIESINPGITFRDAYPRVIELLAITIDSTIGELSEERNQAYRNNLQYLNNNQAVYHVMDLISEAITNNPFEDILGEVYMEKVSTKGTREKGQVFTPKNVAKMMAQMGNDKKENIEEIIQNQGGYTISDSCCGSGVIGLATAEHLNEMDSTFLKRTIFTAEDIDRVVAMMCYIQYSLNTIMGEIIVHDALRNPTEYKEIWYTPAMKLAILPKEAKTKLGETFKAMLESIPA